METSSTTMNWAEQQMARTAHVGTERVETFNGKSVNGEPLNDQSLNIKIHSVLGFDNPSAVTLRTLRTVKTRPPRDEVDVIVEFMCRANPDVDPITKQLGIRLRRAAHHLERALRQELAANGMEMWELEVLLSLHRAEGHRRSAGDLLRESQVTSGAITNRVARLEERGWVRRDVDPSDRRQVLVTMTPAGLERAREVMATKTHADAGVFGRLDDQTRTRLNDDLRTLLIALEGAVKDGDEGAIRPDRRADLAP
jgi:DNA-binding MarR family transcriptional regulator